MKKTTLKTPLGIAKIEGDENGISKITILDNENLEENIDEIPAVLQACVEQLTAYFEGKLQEFNLKLNPQGTEFQKKVWKTLQEIPFGETTSYLALSKKLGNIKAIRAVAAANGKNPLWIVIPCHRVIGSDGSLIGYAGGLWRKEYLLELENPSAQQRLF
ncbi:methylated-DNA--[protein]-cysteine S-methyltransferase [Mesonia maritima]|uniref:Methylated-DNA--protein-cysteine methyltransferase n=1 Tax=Mesonia maritima TaxID=1793873 RepID=A0ABU1K266_9FLAO|nr:methylated-DNA--[protein]-cysteine S-methyltransferase [Mesonia maritima]MDR6299700.1 methylated-DNA-[protein]-cysteine S-methyltransferase [Mesonia maritima]